MLGDLPAPVGTGRDEKIVKGCNAFHLHGLSRLYSQGQILALGLLKCAEFTRQRAGERERSVARDTPPGGAVLHLELDALWWSPFGRSSECLPRKGVASDHVRTLKSQQVVNAP